MAQEVKVLVFNLGPMFKSQNLCKGEKKEAIALLPPYVHHGMCTHTNISHKF